MIRFIFSPEKISKIKEGYSAYFKGHDKVVNFLLDQNLENFNKNQVELGIVYPSAKFNLSFLEESQHIGHTIYVELLYVSFT